MQHAMKREIQTNKEISDCCCCCENIKIRKLNLNFVNLNMNRLSLWRTLVNSANKQNDDQNTGWRRVVLTAVFCLWAT